MSYQPHYLIINQQEVHRLVEHKVGATVWAVYSALCAYTGKDKSCFPSHATIKSWLKADYAMETICRAVKKLESIGVIKREHKTSKNRYEMIFRRAVQVAKAMVKRNRNQPDPQVKKASIDSQVKRRRMRNKTSFKKQKNKISSFFGLGETREETRQRTEQNPASDAMSALLFHTYDRPDIQVLTPDQRISLLKGLEGNTHELEWRSWVMETHKDKIPSILSQLRAAL